MRAGAARSTSTPPGGSSTRSRPVPYSQRRSPRRTSRRGCRGAGTAGSGPTSSRSSSTPTSRSTLVPSRAPCGATWRKMCWLATRPSSSRPLTTIAASSPAKRGAAPTRLQHASSPWKMIFLASRRTPNRARCASRRRRRNQQGAAPSARAPRRHPRGPRGARAPPCPTRSRRATPSSGTATALFGRVGERRGLLLPFPNKKL
mmetsp:Transcript_20022/g.52055  ORF Transcript_20022/g.52055 Transcript_20022/m.52055 type:complete len:203 (+) Transcript_20022:1162-1770(+)